MNKLILLSAIAVGLTPVASMAKGSASDSSPQITLQIPFNPNDRVLTFNSPANAISDDGKILVCLPRFTSDWGPWCRNNRGENAWSLAEDSLPGYTLNSYEFRYSGTSGYRTVILYFSKK